MYGPSYHDACNELIHNGAMRPERAAVTRLLVARALRDLRREQGAYVARVERRKLRFIAGFFPDKPTAPNRV